MPRGEHIPDMIPAAGSLSRLLTCPKLLALKFRSLPPCVVRGLRPIRLCYCTFSLVCITQDSYFVAFNPDAHPHYPLGMRPFPGGPAFAPIVSAAEEVQPAR